jgi:hypothetical protein
MNLNLEEALSLSWPESPYSSEMDNYGCDLVD